MSFFQFKQFRIEQEKSAMKVCTDSCILGAWTDPSKAKSILDIGTGTGLLALMLAQKSDAVIDAVELEEDAYSEAKSNFEKSPWNNRLRIYHEKIQDFSIRTSEPYDLIISNPPFFTGQLKSPDEKRNIALHSSFLSFEELSAAVVKLLKTEGRFYIILPPAESEKFREIARYHKLFLHRSLIIKDKSSLPVFRVIDVYSFKNTIPFSAEGLIIKKDNGEYSEEFKELLKEYYLIF